MILISNYFFTITDKTFGRKELFSVSHQKLLNKKFRGLKGNKGKTDSFDNFSSVIHC